MRQLVARQLGRVPEIGFEVAVKCSNGWPVILRNLPKTSSGYPHPNLYYLSCPWLRRELARLEDAGVIGKLQEQLSSDKELFSDLMRAQQKYSDECRRSRRDSATVRNIAGEKAVPEDADVFIAGARKPALLKCLHAHMAYYLVHDGYLLGLRIVSVLTAMECSDNRCSTWAAEIREGGSMTGERQGAS